MQARISHQGEVMVIHLSGRVDVETAQPFREACLNQIKAKKVVFDFQNLSFVGSSGILPFLETLQNYALSNQGSFNFSGVGSEFRKVFSATALSSVQIFEGPVAASLALLNENLAANVVVEAAPLNAFATMDEAFYDDEFSGKPACKLTDSLSEEISS